jgi:ribosomal protein L7/L12
MMDNPYFAGSQNISSRLDELDARLIRRDDIASLLQAGQKINAIKVYREDTGASLADAKAAVERMELAFGLYGTGGTPFAGAQEAASFPGAGGLQSEGDKEALLAEIEQLVVQGKKIAAIKLYRQRTGLGLREAKDAVEQIEHTLFVRGPSSLARTQMDETNTSGRREVNMEALLSEVEQLLKQRNQKIVAIKLYRERTGMGLREAKEAVDQIERDLRTRDFPTSLTPWPGN